MLFVSLLFAAKNFKNTSESCGSGELTLAGYFQLLCNLHLCSVGYMSAEHASVYMWEDIAKASFKLGTIKASHHIA